MIAFLDSYRGQMEWLCATSKKSLRALIPHLSDVSALISNFQKPEPANMQSKPFHVVCLVVLVFLALADNTEAW